MSTTRSTRRWPATPTTVDVKILEDGGVEVTDNGRGIPVAMHATGVPTVDVVMTQLHAGGKFGGDDSAYAVSGGLHGVGVSVVNALSTRLEVEISRDGYRVVRSPTTGRCRAPSSRVTRPRRPGPRSGSGRTRASSRPPNYDFETVARRLQEMAFLNKGLTINLTDERVTREEVVDEVVSDTAEAPEVRGRKSRRIRCAA